MATIVHDAGRDDLVLDERIIRVKFSHSSGNFPELPEIQIKKNVCFPN